MTQLDDNPEQPSTPEQAVPRVTVTSDEVSAVSGDPFSYGASHQKTAALPPEDAKLPEDLRISWSWLHFILFLIFAVGSLIFIQGALVLYYTASHHLTPAELQKLFVDKPQLAVGTNVVWYAAIFLFLYVTISVLKELPFWWSLGWRRLLPGEAAPANPWLYFFAGSGLAICVAVVSSKIRTPENMPIQQMFGNRLGAIMLMCMAVLVAPLVEETIFRGYLYPLFAKSFGMVPGIILTGALFGMMHGAQLGWTWTLVAVLVIVGFIFTFARARTGTVVASFLMHLGYNSFLALSTIISTRGFTHFPKP